MADKILTDEMKKQILTLIGEAIVTQAKILAPIDLGQLRNSIRFDLEGDKVIIGCYVDYADDMEYGTPPEPLTEEEKSNLADWAERHDLPAYPVIKKIEKKGIDAGTNAIPFKSKGGTFRPFLGPAVHRVMHDDALMARIRGTV